MPRSAGHRKPDTGQPTTADTMPVSSTLCARDAAALLGVSERTIRRAILRGELRAGKVSGVFVIARSELDRFDDARRRRGLRFGRHTATGPKLTVIGLPDRPRSTPAQPVPLPDERRPAAPPPLPLTPLIGRTREVAEVRAAFLERDVRLLTLTGPGGVGKTRVALQAAAELGQAFVDGVVFVPLSASHQHDLVGSTVLRALGLRDAGRAPIAERLLSHLRHRHLLLVLDTFEHLLAAGPLLIDWLNDAPNLRILVTSRARLHLSGEFDLPIPPLDLPDREIPLATRDVETAPATRLFVERARAIDPGFAVTDDSAAAITAICRQLDGLPLAIELAAAHSRVLPPPALLARLDWRLPLLAGGPRDVPARLQTMRDALTWSYDLLSLEQQALFRRLAVFAGGFTLDAAEVISEGAGAGYLQGGGQVSGVKSANRSSEPRPLPPVPSVLEGIEALVTHSLLTVEADAAGQPRYGMLDTIREYGLEQLELSGEPVVIRHRHAAYFLELAHRADAAAATEASRWLNRLEHDYDNLRSAIAWFDAADDVERCLRLAAVMAFFWFYRGRLREGLGILAQAIDSSARVPDGVERARAFALSQAGLLATVAGDAPRAIAWLAEAVRLAAETGDAAIEVTARGRLGGVLVSQGRYDEADSYFVANLERARETGEEAWWLAHAEFHLGAIAFAHGDVDAARPLLEASAARYDRIGQPWDAIDPLRYLGLIACATGDTNGGTTLFAGNLARLRAGGSRQGLATALADLAVLATLDKPAHAAELLGAANALRDAEGASFSLPARLRYDAARASALAALGAADFDGAYRSGATRSLPDVLTLAEEILTPAPTDAIDFSPVEAFGLTPRELDVLHLLVQGKTNPEIAEALFIGRQTVATHVRHILAKLGVESRTAAVTRAFQLGLV